MTDFFRPLLELTVILPGMLLAYFPVKPYLKQPPLKLAAWHPASHAARTLVMDENFAQTWYIFWILPLIFIGLNLFMVPKYSNTLYTGRVLQGYFVISLVLLLILLLFYTMFLLMAQSLNKMPGFSRKTIFFLSSRHAMTISVLPLRKPGRRATISATIFSSCPPWQTRKI